MSQMNVKHVRILRHALGMDAATDKPYRNYYMAGEGHESMPELNELLAGGYVTVRDNPGGSGYLFSVTDKGRAVALDACLPGGAGLTAAQRATAQKVAMHLWRADGCPEADAEPTSVGRSWYEARALEVVGGLVALGFGISPPKAAPARAGGARP